MTVIRRRPKAPGQNGKQVLEPDGVSPEGEARRLWVIHPFLIALIPILHLLAANPGQARFNDALVPILVSLGFTVVAFVVLRLVFKNSDTAGLAVSLFLVLFFSTGHLVSFIQTELSPKSMIILLFAALCVILAAGVFILVKNRGRLVKHTHREYLRIAALSLAGIICLISFALFAVAYPLYGLFVAFCVILAVGEFIVVKFRDRLRNPTRILNVVAATLMFLVLVTLFTSGTLRDVAIRTNDVRRAAQSKNVVPRKSADLPDIYYIILDAYGSESFLREEYGYDNSEFIQWLESRGFYVVQGSHSNYNHTYVSLASSLNMTYLDYLTQEMGERSRSMVPLRRMVEDNSLMRFLKSKGYKFAFFGTGYSVTRTNRYADISQGENWLRSEFIITLFNSTVLRCFRPAFATRESVQKTFADIPLTGKKVKEPLFLFAHILPPHPPYLFDSNGKSPKSTGDAKAMSPPGTLYLNQLTYVNKKVKEMVDEILSASDRPPIIVVQGDHGPIPDGKNPTTENLNALLVPNGKNLFYPSMTPVNSFRIILNSIFGTNFNVLSDRVYVCPELTPYAFKEITKTLDGGQ